MRTRQFVILVPATIVLWWGIAINALSSDFTIFPDSASYQVAGGFPVSFTGDSWRAWPVPLLFSAVSDYRAQSLLQCVLYGLSWTIVLWVFVRGARPWLLVVLATALVAVALTPLYLQWTMTILSEGTTLSALLIGLAMGGLAYRRLQVVGVDPRTWMMFLAMILTIGVASMNRPTLIAFLVFLGIAVVARAWSRRNRRTAAAWLALVLLAVSYVVWLNGRIDDHWGMSRSATYYGYLTATGTPAQEVLANPLYGHIIARGPECMMRLRARAGGVDGPDPWQLRRVMNEQCPEGARWLNERFQGEYVKFLTSHPAYTLRFVLQYLPSSGDPAGYGQTLSILPSSVAGLFSSADLPGQSFRPIYLWVLAGICLLAVGLLPRWRSVAWARGGIPLAGAAASLVSLAITVLTLNSEVARISSQATALLIVCVLIAAATMFAPQTGESSNMNPHEREHRGAFS